MRTENDLRAVLRRLEPPAPDEATVLRGVRRRVARRRILRAGGLTSVTSLAAAVTAVAIVTGTAPGPAIAGGHHPPAPKKAIQRAQTAAYIVQHAAAAEALAARMIQVTRDRAGVNYLSVATQQTVFVSSRRTSHGQPLMASAENIKGTTYTNTLIDYKDRVYTVNSASTVNGGPWGAKGIVIGSWLPGVTASDPASAYTAALKKGFIKVSGYQKLDGRQTILIQINYRKVKLHICQAQQAGPCQGLAMPARPDSCTLPPAPVNEVWLDASTYLEVQQATIEPRTVMHLLHKPRIVRGRLVERVQPRRALLARGVCYKVVGWSATTTSVDWLPPTKQNRSLLNLTPPAGFIQVSNQQIAQYLGPYS
jgi:hypothetical protein